jgi:hypothetical protein
LPSPSIRTAPARLASVARDVRALGPWAPLRAAYELSKRRGGHDLIFGRAVATSRTVRSTSPFPIPAAVPERARSRVLDEAARIVDGEVVVFGRRIEIGPDPDWHHAIATDGHWPLVPWWRIDIRSEARVGDVKWTWELGRHRHLVVLARAVHLDPGHAAWADRLNAHLRSWLLANRPEYGVHWYSNLEISLRSVAWLQVLALAGAVLQPDVRRGMDETLYHSGRHLLADAPYTLSAMRNNHLLGDALGLLVLGRAFRGDRAAARWARFGEAVFAAQAGRQLGADGAGIEDSLSYHRFVLEMLAVRCTLGDAPASVAAGLAAGAALLARLGALAGPVPQFGDWDEGRVLAAAGPPDDLRGIVRLAFAIGAGGSPPSWREDHDEVAWYAPDGPATPVMAEPERTGHDVGGGLARAESGGITAFLKAGSRLSHGHADLLSVTIRCGPHWVVGDPGTGSYNAALDERNYFRSSLAHSVLRVDQTDQLDPHRRFRWLHSAEGRIGPPLRLGEGVVMWGCHDAFTRLRPSRRVARAVILCSGCITVVDWIEGGPSKFALSVPLHPDVAWADGTLRSPAGAYELDLPAPAVAISGSRDPFDGWWSDTYGERRPSVRLAIAGVADGPVVWAMRPPDLAPHGVAGGRVIVGPTELSVEWTEDAVVLRAADAAGETTSLLPWAPARRG